MGKIKLAAINGHIHLLIQGSVGKGQRSVKRRLVELGVDTGVFVQPDDFGRTHRLDSSTIMKQYRIDKQWDWVERGLIWSDLGHITDTGSFKVGDEIWERQFSIKDGIIKLKA